MRCDSEEGGHSREGVSPCLPCLQQGADDILRSILAPERHFILKEERAAKVKFARLNLDIDMLFNGCRIQMRLGGNRPSKPLLPPSPPPPLLVTCVWETWEMETLKAHALCWWFLFFDQFVTMTLQQMALGRREDSQFIEFPFHVHFEQCGYGNEISPVYKYSFIHLHFIFVVFFAIFHWLL